MPVIGNKKTVMKEFIKYKLEQKTEEVAQLTAPFRNCH